MKQHLFSIRNHMQTILPVCSLVLVLGVALPAFAQQGQGNMPGYPSGSQPQSSAPADNNNNVAQAPEPQGAETPPAPPQQNPAPNTVPPQNGAPSAQAVPQMITVPAGTVIQVRTDEWLSTDRNLPGDGFNATIAQPIVVDGWVVARRGQAVLGRVTLVQKARSSNHNTSQLGMQLSELTFVDGQLLPIQTQLSQSGTGPDRGQQVGTVGATTGTGAVIGAIAGGGPGAAIGAGIGAIAGLGIISNTGRPTVVPPETLLTFRLEAPVSISTEKSQLAFHPAGPADYNGSSASNGPRRNFNGGGYPPPPPPYWGYPYAYSPFYYPGWGFYPAPVFGFGFGFGPRYYGRFR
jgi:hypothetical protein